MCLPAIVGWTKLGLWKSAIPFFPYLILTDNFGRNKTRAKLFRRFWSELYMTSFASQYLAGQILNFQIKGLWILLRKPCVSQNSATFTGLLVANVSGWQIHRVSRLLAKSLIYHSPPPCATELGGLTYLVRVLNLGLFFRVLVGWTRFGLSFGHPFNIAGSARKLEQTYSSSVNVFLPHKIHKWDKS